MLIHLTQGRVAQIDDADYERVSKHRWYSHVSKRRGKPTNYYARATIKGKKVYLHRFLTDAPADMDVDHLDGDGLNCKRENLEVVEHVLNMHRSHKRKHMAQCCRLFIRLPTWHTHGHAKWVSAFQLEPGALTSSTEH